MLQGHSFSYRDYALALTTRTLEHIADQNWQTPLWSDYGQYEPGRVDEIVAREKQLDQLEQEIKEKIKVFNYKNDWKRGKMKKSEGFKVLNICFYGCSYNFAN